MSQESKFPMRFDRCPLCHSKERVVEGVITEEKAKGKIAADRIATSSMRVLPCMDPLKGPVLSAPVLSVYTDICGKCGLEYITLITYKEMPAHQIQALMGPMVAQVPKQK